MSSQESESRDATSPVRPKRQAATFDPAANQANATLGKKASQRKLTPKQLMKVRRLKERDEKKASKQKEQELRASYTALTPCKTTLDPTEPEPAVGDKLIVRDEYNVK
jgi:hypothetical protein